MQQLDSGNGVSVGVVGVREKCSCSVGEVVSVGTRVDLEVVSEVCCADEAKLGGELYDRVFFRGCVGDDEEAVGEKFSDGFEHVFVIVERFP